jgi:hypothetical protein
VTKKYVCGSLYDEEKRLWQNVCGKTFVEPGKICFFYISIYSSKPISNEQIFVFVLLKSLKSEEKT